MIQQTWGSDTRPNVGNECSADPSAHPEAPFGYA